MTGIQWTDKTWNPTTGCDRVSPGCDHCYALTLAARLKAMGNPRYQVDGDPKTSGSGFGLTIHEDKLGDPFTWKKPRRVFVNSMSDLFHGKVPTDFIEQVFAVMALNPQHQFQVLTKRPRRMQGIIDPHPDRPDPEQFAWRVARRAEWIARNRKLKAFRFDWPLPNVWLGTSIENQEYADKRVGLLLKTPAAVRFLSCEPLLGPIDFRAIPPVDLPGIRELHWVIVGGESGPGHRPIKLEWVRSLRDQCSRAGVAFFYKQGSGPRPGMHRELDGRRWEEMPA